MLKKRQNLFLIFHLHLCNYFVNISTSDCPSIVYLRILSYIYLMSGIGTPQLTQSFELLSGSIGWGAGPQSSRLVQSKSSNPLKVLNKEYKNTFAASTVPCKVRLVLKQLFDLYAMVFSANLFDRKVQQFPFCLIIV